MHEDVRALLNAYLDGELQGTRLLEIKHHLASCESCRNELEELRFVSDLLQAAPAPVFTPAGRFTSNLSLTLPRRTLRHLPPKPGSLAWWLIPTGLLAAWFFVHTLYTLSDAVMAAGMTGLLGQAGNWLGGGKETIWFAIVTSLFGAQAGGTQSTLSMMNELNIFGVNMIDGFLWQALIAGLYWGWLFVWWLRRGPRPVQMGNV